MRTMAQQLGWPEGWACDWRRNMYTPGPVEGISADQPLEVVVPVEYQNEYGDTINKTYKVLVKYAAAVDLGALDRLMSGHGEGDEGRAALQVLDIVLRSGAAARDNAVVVRNSVYLYLPKEPAMYCRMSKGTAAWAGFKQAVKPCQYGLSLNIDLATSAFMVEQPLLDLAAELVGAPGAKAISEGLRGPADAAKVKRGLKGLLVSIHLPNGKALGKRIRDVGDTRVDRTMFTNDSTGGQISVAAYFRDTYGVEIAAPGMPPVNVGMQRNKPVWYPMDLCSIRPHQRCMKLDPVLTTDMIKFAGLDPTARRNYLEKVLKNPSLGDYNSDPAVKAFGITVSSAMKEVVARLLPHPRLVYGEPACLDPETQGFWSMNKVKRFYQAKSIISWAVVALAPQREVEPPGPASLRAFVSTLRKKLQETGMSSPEPPCVYMEARNVDELTMLRKGVEAATTAFGKPPEILLVLLMRKPGPYKEVKLASDVELGIPSQCFLATKAGVGRQDQKGGQMQYCANLALKMNAKLGGKNVKFLLSNDMVVPALRSRPSFMVMGADVTHPTGAGRAAGEPSVTAITASHDPDLAQWASRVLLQEGGQEVIINLVDTVKELLMSYYEANGRKPEAIIYYRDGVAEGQFAQVLRHEYSAIREACFAMEASGNYCPPITFVVVQKRHNTRFFPAPGDNSNRDKTGNCLPGTVVDRGSGQ